MLLLYSLYTYGMIPHSKIRIIGHLHKVNRSAISKMGNTLVSLVYLYLVIIQGGSFFL